MSEPDLFRGETPILRCSVRREKTPHPDGSPDYSDQTPEEYVITRFGEGRAQIIIYGRYGDRWEPNVSARGLVEDMMTTIADLRRENARLREEANANERRMAYIAGVRPGGKIAEPAIEGLVDVEEDFYFYASCAVGERDVSDQADITPADCVKGMCDLIDAALASSPTPAAVDAAGREGM